MIRVPARKRIVVGIVIDTDFKVPPLTGVTYRLYYLSKEIQRQGVDVKIFVCNRNIVKSTDVRRYLKDSGLEIHIIPEKVFYNFNQMLGIIKENKITILQVENIQSAVLFSRVAIKLGILLNTELHDIEATLKQHFHYDPKDINESLTVTRIACNVSDAITCMTKFDYHELINKVGVKKSKISLLPNPVDAKAFPYFGPELSNKKIIFIGNMYYPPNMQAAHNIVNKISKNVLRDFKTVKFELAGMAPVNFKRKLKNSHVKFVGPIKDLNSFLSNATIALCPVTEGSGMKVKILNYCAAGIPVITTSLGRSGFEAIESLIVEDDLEKYPQLIKSLLVNNKKIVIHSKNIRQQILRHYDIILIAKKAIKAYKKISNANHPNKRKTIYDCKRLSPLLWHSEKRIKRISNSHYYVTKNGKIITQEIFS